MHWIFCIVLISFCGGIKAETECEKKNKEFALSNSDFIQCVTKHDKSANYCLGCSRNYTTAAVAYLKLTHDDPNSSIPCRPDYVDNNLLNLVDVLMSNTQRIWDMAVCSDCFEGKCDATNPDELCVISSRTQDFVHLHEQAFNCINQNGKASCKLCNEEYNNLTKLNEKIRKETGDKYCFDLKNMMNQTQKLWSLKYHCCDDKNPPAIAFYALSASSFFIAIFFYGTAFLCGRRKPEIPYIPDDLLPIDHSRSAHDSSVSLSDNEHPEPFTSTNSLEPSLKLAESTDETDDDDQPIFAGPMSNPNLIKF